MESHITKIVHNDKGVDNQQLEEKLQPGTLPDTFIDGILTLPDIEPEASKLFTVNGIGVSRTATYHEERLRRLSEANSDSASA
jgi:hypothetical protein